MSLADEVTSPFDAQAVDALRSAVTFPTISSSDTDRVDRAAFDGLLSDLEARFPRLHHVAEVTRVAGSGLLVRWPGRGGSRPVVLLAHLDVTPAGPGDAWTHPPFEGVVEDGAVWGRGTLDAKGSAVAICSAVERLVTDGFAPASDVWLSFGCDGQVGGSAAAEAVAALEEFGVDPWFVLDEGGTVADDAFPGVVAPLAVIGVAEKGIVDLELRVDTGGGHPSMPPQLGPGERLARALHRLTRRPFRATIPDPVVEMLTAVSPHTSGPLRWVTRNARLLRWPLARVFARLGAETAALARTTTTVTSLQAACPSTELVEEARAVITLRVMVGETVDSVIERVRRTVRDPQVTVTLLDGEGPSPIAPRDDAAYQLITSTLGEVMPEAVPVPYVMLAPTDARHFHRVWPRVYRFTPFRANRYQRRSLRSADERLEVRSFLEGVHWYRRLLEEV